MYQEVGKRGSVHSEENEEKCDRCSSFLTHWGQGDLETGDYMLGTFRAHVHLSHNVTGG